MHAFIIIGYSNGRPMDANDASINSGGQCSVGLKMVVLIGEVNIYNLTPGRHCQYSPT